VNQRLEAEKDRKPERNHGKRGTRTVIIDGEHLALEALPTVIDIMSKELGWDRERQDKEFRDATKFLRSRRIRGGRPR
jgi:glycerol-3-phosphate dehydrogenase